MHISLTPELENLVKARLESGLYNNASEVVREALRFMELNQDLVYQIKLDRLRAALAVGEAELDNGQGVILKNEDDIKLFFAKRKKRQ